MHTVFSACQSVSGEVQDYSLCRGPMTTPTPKPNRAFFFFCCSRSCRRDPTRTLHGVAAPDRASGGSKRDSRRAERRGRQSITSDSPPWLILRWFKESLEWGDGGGATITLFSGATGVFVFLVGEGGREVKEASMAEWRHHIKEANRGTNVSGSHSCSRLVPAHFIPLWPPHPHHPIPPPHLDKLRQS